MRTHITIAFCTVLMTLGLSTKLPAQTVKKMTILELESYIAHSDHPLIVDFWATFCAPCVKEIPYLQSTADKYKADGVELLLVSLDLPDSYPSKISAHAEKNNYHVPIIWLNETNADYFCPKIDKKWSGGIPSSLFINNKTKYRKFFDRQLTDLQVEQEVKLLVKG